jgi:hypothetical protein
MQETKQHPLVLIFYLNREMMQRQEIIKPFAESVNNIISVKGLNAIAFFLPTDGEERLECINPVIAPKEEMERISKLIEDISNQFGVGKDIDNLETEE